jgi:hypothetical protein
VQATQSPGGIYPLTIRFLPIAGDTMITGQRNQANAGQALLVPAVSGGRRTLCREHAAPGVIYLTAEA